MRGASRGTPGGFRQPPPRFLARLDGCEAKQVYASEAEARALLVLHPELARDGVRAYRCRYAECGLWHLGHARRAAP